ncbi:MAG: hypothetical protein FK734_21800 [Asgard group archaeon]|nr:hypothetical protein [Asgard group archaeon]
MSKEVQVKNYRITFVKKPVKGNEVYEVDVRATSKDDALQKAYARIGSKHRITRLLLHVKNIKEIEAAELKDNILLEIAADDKVQIHPSK